MDELRDMKSLSNSIQALFSVRDRNISNPSTIVSSQDQNIEIRKKLAMFSSRLKTLESSLENDKVCSEGELKRRLDLVQNLKLDRDRFQRMINKRPNSGNDR